MQPDTKVRLKSTGQIGYVVKEDEDGMLCVRIPSDSNWPFPNYIFIRRKDVTLAKVSNQTSDIEESPF